MDLLAVWANLTGAPSIGSRLSYPVHWPPRTYCFHFGSLMPYPLSPARGPLELVEPDVVTLGIRLRVLA